MNSIMEYKIELYNYNDIKQNLLLKMEKYNRLITELEINTTELEITHNKVVQHEKENILLKGSLITINEKLEKANEKNNEFNKNIKKLQNKLSRVENQK